MIKNILLKQMILSKDLIKKLQDSKENGGAEEIEPSEDCISRAYIESIVEELENICINGDDYILSLLSNIKNAPSVTPQQTRWIPCSERLPEENGNYLVTVEANDGTASIKYQMVDHYGPKWLHEGKYEKVIAWMPLPEPYQSNDWVERGSKKYPGGLQRTYNIVIIL